MLDQHGNADPRTRQYLGSYMVALNGKVDALVFTGGLGEKSHLLRTLVCEGLEGMGLVIDEVLSLILLL